MRTVYKPLPTRVLLLLAGLVVPTGALASQPTLTATDTTTFTHGGQVMGAEFDLSEIDEVLAAALRVEIEAIDEPSSTRVLVARLVVVGGTGPLPSSAELAAQTATGQHLVYLRSDEGPKLVDVSWLLLGDRSTTSRMWIALASKHEDAFEGVQFVEASVSLHLQEPTGISHAAPPQVSTKGSATEDGSDDQVAVADEMADARLQVSPNPLRSAATVFLRAPESGVVTLEIFDVSGRRVFETRLRAATGVHQELTWPGTDTTGRPVASGVYYVRAHGAGIHLSKKVVLVR